MPPSQPPLPSEQMLARDQTIGHARRVWLRSNRLSLSVLVQVSDGGSQSCLVMLFHTRAFHAKPRHVSTNNHKTITTRLLSTAALARSRTPVHLPTLEALLEHPAQRDLSRASPRATRRRAALATATHATTSHRLAGSKAGQNERPGRHPIAKLNDYHVNNQLDLWR